MSDYKKNVEVEQKNENNNIVVHGSEGDDEPDAQSPAQPNAEHFPNTAKLLKTRKNSTSPTPEVSPPRQDGSRQGSAGGGVPVQEEEVSPDKVHADAEALGDDHEGAEGDAEGDSPAKRSGATKRRAPANRNSQSALADRVQDRMDQAQQRRDELFDQRADRLRKTEQHRQQKTILQKEMRQEALRRFVRDAPALLNSLSDAGLALPAQGTQLDGNAVQHILVTDPRVCAACPEGSADIYQRVCPTSGKPHRRRLVLLAEQLLKLIGETRVNLIVRKDAVGDQALAMSSNKARRGIAINPQIFILAYYNAAVKGDAGGMGEEEEDPLLQAAARQLVECVSQMDKVLKLNIPGNETAKSQTEITIKPLLITFAKHWLQYAKLADAAARPAGDAAAATEANRQKVAAANEVLESTIATAVFVHRNWKEVEAKDMDPEEKQVTLGSLHAYSQMLFHRALSIAGEEGVKKLKERLTAETKEEEAAAAAAGKPSVGTTSRPTLLTTRASMASNVVDSSEEEGASQRGASASAGVSSSTTTTRGPSSPASAIAASLPPGSPVMLTAPVLDHQPTASVGPRSTFSQASRRTGATGAGSDSMYTSGSETDVGRWNNHRNREKQKKPMGPELPPRWFVDEDGISQPPKPPTAEELQKEQYKALEHKAKVSYEAKLPLFRESSQGYVDEAAEARKAFQAQLTDGFWDLLKHELNASPPVVTRVPVLLSQVTTRLIEAVPKRYQQRINQELRDVLDWDMLKYRMADPKHLSELMRYVVSKVINFGTPAREDGLKKQCLEIATKLTTSSSSSFGETVVEMFQFLLEAIHNLLGDITEYQLAVLKPELAQRATEFQRNFTEKCLPGCDGPNAWPSTLKWLCQAVKRHPTTATTATTTPGANQQQDAFFVRDTVLHGIVDLLISGNTSPETRWDFFPQETMHFDKPHIFTAANIIQLLTLRLMIVGTVQLILSRRKVAAANTTFLRDLDDTLVSLLSNKPSAKSTTTAGAGATGASAPMTLESLKYQLVEEVNMFLADRALNPQPLASVEAAPRSRFAPAGATAPVVGAPAAGELLTPLTQVESDTIRHAVETMTTTTSLQYTTFEKRIIAALRDLVHSGVTTNTIPKDAFKLGTTSTSVLPANFAFANHVPQLQAELFNTARDVASLVAHHLDVYSPSYQAVFRTMVEQQAKSSTTSTPTPQAGEEKQPA